MLLFFVRYHLHLFHNYRQKQMFYDPHEKMINTTEETEYDFWYSSAAADELGCKNFVNGKPYTERIIRGKQPHLKAKYNDLVLVCSGAAKDQDITIKYKY